MSKRDQSYSTKKTLHEQSNRQDIVTNRAGNLKPSQPSETVYEKAVIQALSSAPLIVAVLEGREYNDIKSALDGKYNLKVMPRVGGGEIYVWSNKNAPSKTWIQAEHVNNNIFEVALQIGLQTQRAMFLVDLNNGAVEKKYDTFSAQMGY